ATTIVIYTLSYTTLFRSESYRNEYQEFALRADRDMPARNDPERDACTTGRHNLARLGRRCRRRAAQSGPRERGEDRPAEGDACRSEEHTSELQSRSDLVC